jgi:hypothetical protein
MTKSVKPRVEEWKIDYRVIGLQAAQVVQGRLETAGIPAVLDYDGTTTLLGIPTYGGTGEVRIPVPLERIADARELLGPDSELLVNRQA